MRYSFFILFFIIISLGNSFFAQKKVRVDSLISDTINIQLPKKHSPTKATLFSTFLPGLGQVYNKKYWKVPIVFAAIGTPLYFAISNNRDFKHFKEAYLFRIDDDPNTIDEYVDRLSEAGLRANMDFHQRTRDLMYIFTGVFYVLNIVDAAVDAHLFNFPKNDKLSFNLQPTIKLTANNKYSSGFKLVIYL